MTFLRLRRSRVTFLRCGAAALCATTTAACPLRLIRYLAAIRIAAINEWRPRH